MWTPARILFGASICALAMLASAYFLNGNPAGPWVDAAIYIATGAFFANVLTPKQKPQSAAG